MLALPQNPILARESRAAKLAGQVAGESTTLRTREKHTMLQAARIDAALDQIERLPDEGETLHAIMDGRYHAWDLVPAIILLARCKIVQLTITTLSFNLRQANQLAAYLEAGEIAAADFVCSHMYWQKEKTTCHWVATNLRKHGGEFAVAQNHSKVLLAELEDGRQLVSESSANMRSCNALEQFALACNAELYDWHRQWITHLLHLPNPMHPDQMGPPS